MTTETLRCAFVGEQAMVVSCAEVARDRGHHVTGVVSPNEDVRAWARERGIPAAELDGALADFLAEHPCDYLFSVGNLTMLPERVLATPRRGAINFHDGPLPAYAGRHATTWSLLDRADSHGITWHVMTAEADAGDILVRRDVPVDPDDTSYTLNVKCFDAGIDAFGELIDALADGRVRPEPQDRSRRTYHGRFDRPAGGGLVSWESSPEQVCAAVRATDFGPHTNEFGHTKLALASTFVSVGAARVLDRKSGREPGTVVDVGDDGLVVATRGHDLRLSGLTSATGEPVRPASHGIREGDRLPDPGEAVLRLAGEADSRFRRHEPFWVRRLRDLRPLDLPHRDGRADDGPTTTPVPVPADAPARQEWLLAATLAFLARITDGYESDVDLRTTAQRTDDRLAGLYADHVPLRLPAVGELGDLRDVEHRVSDQLAELSRRGTFPTDVWARYPELRDGRTAASGLPIAVELQADLTEPARPRPGTALLVRISSDGTGCDWTVARATLTREFADALVGHLATFLRAAAGPAGRDLRRAPLCSDGELRRMLVEFNDTAVDFPETTAVHELFAERARSTPDANAVVCDGRVLTYGELDRRSASLAADLRARGAGPGALVGVYLRRSEHLPVALLGVLRSGAAYVPLDPLYPRARIDHMLTVTGATLVVTRADLVSQLPDRTEPVLVDQPREHVVAPAVTPGRLAYVIFTSGSTGRPKGVRVSHPALTNFLTAMAREPGFTADDSLLAVTTVCFDIAALELFLPLVTGGRVEIAPEDDVADGFALRSRLDGGGITMLQATPATWRMLLDAGWRPNARTRMLCGGEALPADLAAALLAGGGELWNMYGPTETTIWSSASRVTDAERLDIGRPIANTRFYVLDGDRRPRPPGIPGELYIGGAGVADGYLGATDRDDQRFVPDPLDPASGPLYRTGDAVRHRPDGGLEYLRRLDDQVKLHGYRIELGEIEHRLRACAGVKDAVTVVREDRPGDRRLVAYLVTDSPGAPVPELRAHLGQDLPDYMIPSAYVRVERIPTTDNGKVDRKALPRPTAAGAGGRAPVSSDLEREIADVWRAVLGVEELGVDDNFFEVGGNSLLLMRVLARLRERVTDSVSRVEMFRYPTIRTLARRLSTADGRAAGSAVAGHTSTPARTRRGDRTMLTDLRRKRRQRRPR